jgi:stearoyl-CoA desaturase (delta-9 desaturase)
VTAARIRNYETDDSRNNWWVALLAHGEGWHNNHHAHQRAARHGHRWWEFDATYAVIWAMERCGLAWNVSRGLPERSRPSQEVVPGRVRWDRRRPHAPALCR